MTPLHTLMPGTAAAIALFAVPIVMCQASDALNWSATEVTIRASTTLPVAAYDFTFRNDSNRKIKIVAVEPSCDCTTAATNKRVYDPGEAGLLHVEVQTAGRQGPSQERLRITADDHPNQQVTLTVNLEMPEPVALRPRILIWRSGETPNERVVEVKVADSSTTWVDSLGCEVPNFQCRLENTREAGRYRILIKPTSTAHPIQTTVRVNSVINRVPTTLLIVVAIVGG